MLERVIQQIRDSDTLSRTGKIENIIGMSIEASGGRGAMGDICRIYSAESNSQVLAEVVGFKNEHMLLMPYQNMSGLAPGSFVRNTGRRLRLRVGDFLRGRIINAMGQPIDGGTAFPEGESYYVDSPYINPLTRPPIRERIEEYSSDRTYLEKVAAAGAERARESAEATLREIRSIVGFPPYRG